MNFSVSVLQHIAGSYPNNFQFMFQCIIIQYKIKIQLDATVCSLIYFTTKSLYMFRVSQHPSSGVLKSVTAASGTGHNIGTATSL